MLNSYEATRIFEKSNYVKSEGNGNIHLMFLEELSS